MKRILLFLILMILIGCTAQTKPVENSQLANPASVYCKEQGGTSNIATAEDGSQSGICTLKDGTKCDEWAYFRKECPVQEKTSSDKFLIHFPWTKGEKWEFVTGFHDENCLDFANFDSEKAPIVAAADGEVLLSTHSYPNEFNTYSPVETNNIEDMGNFVILKHKPQTYTVYMHFQQELTPPVKPGDSVKAGQRIGYEGNTGWSHGKHIHFCVVDVSIFPVPSFIKIPLDSWGFVEADNSNNLVLNEKYESQNS